MGARRARRDSTTPFWWGTRPDAAAELHPLGLADVGVGPERVAVDGPWALVRGAAPFEPGPWPDALAWLGRLSAYRAPAPPDARLRPVFDLGLPCPAPAPLLPEVAPLWRRALHTEQALTTLASADPDERAAARAALREGVGGYGLFTGQAAAVIDRILHAGLGAREDAPELLVLAVDLAAGDHRGVVATGLDPTVPYLRERLTRAPARALHAALAAAAPEVVKLLSHADARRRAAAALLLGVARASAAWDPLRAALADEPDADAAASLALALGLVGRAREADAPAVLVRRLADADPLVAGACTLAGLTLDGRFFGRRRPRRSRPSCAPDHATRGPCRGTAASSSAGRQARRRARPTARGARPSSSSRSPPTRPRTRAPRAGRRGRRASDWRSAPRARRRRRPRCTPASPRCPTRSRRCPCSRASPDEHAPGCTCGAISAPCRP